MEKNKKLPKAVKIIGIVLLVLAIVWGGFTIVSHAVYHRSNMATLVEIYFRVLGTKDTFSDEEKCAEYIEKRRNAEEYTLNVKLKSEISESSVNECKIYSLSQTETPDYTILYLHGGAYINDASAYQWKLCDKMVCVRPDGAFESPATVSSVCCRARKVMPDLGEFHFHLLRHTFTTNLLTNGAAPKDVQELLGHSDVGTTMNIYAHANRETKRSSARMLDQVVS